MFSLVKGLVIAAGLTLPLVAGAQSAAPATLVIDAHRSAHAVSPTLYGLMTEEINYSYDGGLYAELVRNRTFTHDWSGIARWNLDDRGTGLAKMTYDEKDGPTAALPGSLRVEVLKADAQNPAGIRNDGYWGIKVQPNTTYTGSFYARADSEHSGPVTLSLVSNITGQTVASTTVAEASGKWARYEYRMTSHSVAPSANYYLRLGMEKPGTLWLQLVSLFPPTYMNQRNGFRPDLMEMMAAMHPRFLRLPGGNYLEGNTLVERFDWKKTIGPLADRPTHPSPWGYQSTDGLGLLEFMLWCEELHIDPVLAVFSGYTLNHDVIKAGDALTPYVDDALDELEFLTGAASTKWGAVRVKLGHPAPFALHYIEIGNEDDFDKSGSYEDRYQQFYKAIKAKYPQFELIATTPLKQFQPDVVDDHYYKRADDFFDFNQHYDNVDRKGPKIFIGEWATREGLPTTNLGAALSDAAWMLSMERNSDLIVMSAYAPMLVNVNPGGMQWESNLIGYNAEKAYGSPSYYAQCLFGQYLGDQYLAGKATAGPRFYYSATRNTKRGKIYLKLVNALSTPQLVHISLEGGSRVSENATLLTLSGSNTAETNSIEAPTRIVPLKTAIKAGSTFDHAMPAYSVQVIVLSDL